MICGNISEFTVLVVCLEGRRKTTRTPVICSYFPRAETPKRKHLPRNKYSAHLCYEYPLTYFSLLYASLKMAEKCRNM
jgi:hypothetical protein